MLNFDSNENRNKSIGLRNWQNNNFAREHVKHTFYGISLPLHENKVKLLTYKFSVVISHKKILLLVLLFPFFFTAAHFQFAGR